MDESRDELKTWLPWVDNTKTVADEEKFLSDTLAEFGTGDSMSTIIFTRIDLLDDGFNRFRSMDKSAEIGYWLGTKFVGKGIMHRAVSGMSHRIY